MNRRYLLLLLAAVVMTGCATTGEPVVVERVPEAVEAPIQKEPVTIEVEVPHMTRETRYFRDGTVDTYLVLSYQEDTNRLLKEVEFDSFDEVKKTVQYLYPRENTVRRETMDNTGALLSYDILQYSQDGLLLSEESFTAEDEAMVSTHTRYNSQGERLELEVKDGTGTLLSRIVYTPVKDGISESNLYGADGQVRNSFRREVDSEGRLLREQTLNRQGQLEKEVLYGYEGGQLVLEEHFNNAGGLSRRYIYENDEKGSPLRIIMENSRGAVLETYERSYYYTVETVVLEDGE
jgi:antitoxin component YwqK of YwqJK toxin-antitoxin module